MYTFSVSCLVLCTDDINQERPRHYMVSSAMYYNVMFYVFFSSSFRVDFNGDPPDPPPTHRPILILSLSLSSILSHFISHPLLPSSQTLSPLFSVLVSSFSIIVYLHSVHFLPSLMALRWGVFLVRHCNEDWNTISTMATVIFLHHPVLQQSDRCCCCGFGFPVCSYWCVSSSLTRYC